MRERPDLSSLPADVVAYIEALEQELAHLQSEEAIGRSEAPLEPSEPPTTMQVISISAAGVAKRTPRHLYLRQRRGGMGVFDLDAPDGDTPAFLVTADLPAGLILFTNQGRVFRLPVREIPEREVRARGDSIVARFPFRPDERIALVTEDTHRRGAYLIIVSQRGQVRRIAKQYLGSGLQSGTSLYDIREGGAPAAACWSAGNDELFIVTRTGQAIRFAERLVPVRGCLGMRVDPGDAVAGVAATGAGGGIFLLSSDGKGTIRQLSGFGANKSPGAGGKTAMKAEAIVGAAAVEEGAESRTDLFAISRLGKIIRFGAAEVPPKEGVVQGVNCMNLRADECVALAVAAVEGTGAPAAPGAEPGAEAGA
jgi:DNA gyrase subunit A